MKKVGVVLLFSHMLLSSCQASSIRWHSNRFFSKDPCYNSSRLFYPTKDCFAGISVQILYTQGDIWGYLDVYSFPFPDDCEGQELTHVIFSFNDQELSFYAHRFQGYQRLLLPQEATQLLIDALLQGYSVHICAGQFHTLVTPSGFLKQLAHIQKNL